MVEQHAVSDEIAIAQAEAAQAEKAAAPAEEQAPVADRAVAEETAPARRRGGWYRRRYRQGYEQYALQLAVLVLEILIGFRIFLKLINANPSSGFAWFVYGVTDPLLAPFSGLTYTPAVNGSVLEISSLIAMVVYAILFWLILKSWRLVAEW